MFTFSEKPLLLLKTTILACLVACGLVSCGSAPPSRGNHVIVSVKDQSMLLVRNGAPVKTYPISTSKFGLGDKPNSMRTPIGKMRVAKKIGRGAPAGAVFKSRKLTGEVLAPNAPGRDPIVTRILWLQGKERRNRNAFRRYIYIHGTPEERTLGTPSSYGCIRMRSRDIVDLYQRLGVGSEVKVIRGKLKSTEAGREHLEQISAQLESSRETSHHSHES